ncbi:Gfo/Idh/MocA family protein [cyanobacterium endosymbiont of Rhopalodia gibberula]|uniref:Gfo/Idh/MocA family protein n=1 Tax=cyanobacterium endosymbiont of Rhopalodia gibberula TaxID=1763363 RepID=UPI000E652840|nr:Gfo/Idh/MocA family oxidoreductase [cyanobacterium endosymbiont of Rhopalodia gibberula]
MSTIRVAVIGTGFGQAVHIPGLKHHSRTKVIAIYNRDLGKSKAIADFHQIPYAFDDFEKLLSLSEIDAVSLSTPPFLHYEMSKRILEAGKHLLLEKPMAMSAQEARELYYLAQQKELVVTTDFEFRYVPAWQLLSKYLQQNYVGQIRLIKIDWLVASRANPKLAWNWYSCREQGGGVLGAIGSHSFDYIHWLFGPIKRLTARMICAIKERPDPKDNNKLKSVNTDDTCLLMLELGNGVPCQVSLSSVTYNGRGHWIEVYGDHGTLVLGSDNLKDYVHGFHLQAAFTGQSLTEVKIPKWLAFPELFIDGRLAPFIRVVDRWVESIDQGKSLTPSLYEGVYSQLIMDLAYEASDKNCWVDVPNLEQYMDLVNLE